MSWFFKATKIFWRHWRRNEPREWNPKEVIEQNYAIEFRLSRHNDNAE